MRVKTYGTLLEIIIVILMIGSIIFLIWFTQSGFGGEFRATRRAKEIKYLLNELEEQNIIAEKVSD